MQMNRIVLTTDYSDGSAVAAPVAAALANQLGTELVVLHVAERLVDVVPVAAGIPPVELQSDEALNERAREKLHAWATEHLGGARFRAELLEGAAAEEITSFAEESGAGLVVMGTQGHSRLERFFTGSVTEEVLRTSTVPVLVVPASERGRSGKQ